MSLTRKRYVLKFIWRVACLIVFGFLFVWKPDCFNVLEGFRFFTMLSPLHLIWAFWVYDMLSQIFPFNRKISIGSRKLFAHAFRPAKSAPNTQAMNRYFKKVGKRAVLTAVLWCAFMAVFAVLYYTGILNKACMFMLCMLFYVGDLVCVLIWCPFRVIMGSRCCTTCRIFNWDHFFLVSPLIFIGGFYGISLVVLAVICLLRWEIAIARHPERFWEGSNEALQCAHCTDKLCTQYCPHKTV